MAARHTCWSTGPALIHILEPKYCQEEWSGGGMEPHLGLPSWWILAMGQGLHWGRAVLSALSLGDLQFCNDYSEHVPACPVAKRSPFNLSAILAFRHSGILAIRLPRCLAARSVLRQTKPQICTNDVVSCCHCPPFLCFLRLSPAPSSFSPLKNVACNLCQQTRILSIVFRELELLSKATKSLNTCVFLVASCQFTACTIAIFVSTSPERRPNGQKVFFK